MINGSEQPKQGGMDMGFSPEWGGSPSIAGGTDVALNNPLDSEVLAYDATVGKWKNTVISPAGVVYRAVYSTSTSAWPSRPPGATYVEWVGGTSLTPPPQAVTDVDIWIRPAELV